MQFDQSMSKSNYLAEAAPETCKACGLCIKRCPMDAIELKFNVQATNKFRKAVVVDADLCIGCGVCVHKCKPKSIALKRKEETTRPPKTMWSLMSQIGLAAFTAKAKQKGHDKAIIAAKYMTKFGLFILDKSPIPTIWFGKSVTNTVSKMPRLK